MPQHTMNGLEINDDMAANGAQHFRVLRTILTSQLRHLQQSLLFSIRDSIASTFDSCSRRSGEWIELNCFELAKKVMTASNSVAFFGEELSKIPEFTSAALDYPEHLFKTAEVLRLLPNFLAPAIAPILMHRHRASSTLVRYLTPIINCRLSSEKPPNAISEARPVDCIQFFLDTNRKRTAWTSERLIQVLLGIWFAAVHQPSLSLSYALEDLCENPQYIELLRQELETCDISGESLEQLPLLDSFLKESARLHPSDSISVRRKVVRRFKFSDGTTLLPGDVVCAPLQAILRDPSYYTDSMRFDGYRFVDAASKGNSSRFTDSSPAFLLWGLGKHSWYVRDTPNHR